MTTLVLALNPSVDAEWRVDGVRWEEKNTVISERRWAGGKGINVARWLEHLGEHSRLLIPLGGAAGRELHGYLREEGLRHTVVALKGASRTNVIVTSPGQGQLRFNPPGPALSAVEFRAVLKETAKWLARSSCVVLSGSLPRGVSADAYAGMIEMARRNGTRGVLDCDGEPLRRALNAGPFLVKPNEAELGQWAGRTLKSDAQVWKAARAMSGRTGGWVLVSRGADDSLLVNERAGLRFSCRPPRLKPVNTVGAGDALVAGVARQIVRGAAPEDCLRWGVATGAAATQCPGGILPAQAAIRRMAAGLKVVRRA